MIIIKGNLIIDKSERVTLPSMSQMAQIRKSHSSVYEPNGSNPKEIICFVDLSEYDTTEAIVIEGDTVVSNLDVDDVILVTRDVCEKGGEV